MEKCWFVLRQTHYPAPEYKLPGMALGVAEGPVRLGHFIPNPTAIDTAINPNNITTFESDMRVFETKAVNFRFANTSQTDTEASIRGGGAVSGAPGVTLNAEAGMLFSKMMGDTWAIDRLDTQIVQPTDTYLETCRQTTQIAEWIKKHKLLGHYKMYMISGLIIARGANHEFKDSKETGFHGGASSDVPGIASGGAETKHRDKKEMEVSGQYVNDFIWAIRLTEVSKSMFSSEHSHKTVTKGTTLAPGSEKVDMKALLAEQGLARETVHPIEVADEKGKHFFITVDGL